MCPTVKTFDLDNPDEIWVRINIPRPSTDLEAVEGSLPELQNELAERWNVDTIRLSLRNPVNLNQWEILVIIGLAKPILKPLGDKLRDEAFDWLRRRFKRAAKKKGKTRKRR